MKFLLERFETVRSRSAFIDDGRVVSYGEIIDLTGAYLQVLKARGVQEGDVVAFLGDYSPEIFCFILALAENKNTIVPLTRDSVVERDVTLGISECKWFVDFNPENIQFEKFDREPQNALLTGFLKLREPGLILFSSGSTGKPKGILHNLTAVAEKFRVTRQATVAITFLMLDHFGGINTLLAITSSLGTVVTVKNRSISSICEAIQKYKVQTLPTTPSFLNLLVRSGAQNQFDLSSLRLITYGTEVMPLATLSRLQQIFPNVKLQQTYGLSELGVMRSQSRPDGSLWVKIGGEGFQTKVVDDILWVKSAYSMVGYLNAPSPFDSEGWFNTQDRVEVDGEYFKILGRVTDLMNVGGQKVYPAEIEDVILELPNISDVSVFAEKNALLGNIVVAKVLTYEPEAVDVLKKRIRKACIEKLAPFKVPAKVIISDGSLYSSRQKKVRVGLDMIGDET